MIGMIADYKENGADKHCAFLAPFEADYTRAVGALADRLQKQGMAVTCITVCPDVQSLEELGRIAEDGAKPGNVYLPFWFGYGR